MKVTVYPKMKILSSYNLSSYHVAPNPGDFLLWNIKGERLQNTHAAFFHIARLLWYISCLLNIYDGFVWGKNWNLQNVFSSNVALKSQISLKPPTLYFSVSVSLYNPCLYVCLTSSVTETHSCGFEATRAWINENFYQV